MNRKLSGILLFPIMFRNSGAGSEGGDEQALLLQKIGESVKGEIEKRGYQNAESVQKLMDTALSGLNLEALRSFDIEKQNQTLKNIAGELEKVKNIRMGIVESDDTKELIQRSINDLLFPAEGKMSDVELMQRNKGKGGTSEIVLNIRAAANMQTDNTINENNYPLPMIESFNVIDGVVKKRRGTQYIFDIADVTTVAEIEQYTTWLEEGNEQGAFAIVAEGAVKPLVSYALVRNYAQAKKVAAKYVITEEFAKWRKKALQIIQNLINDKILRDYAAILTVDLQAQAAGYVGTSLDDTFVAPNDYDAIGAVAAQIETLNFFPDLLIIHLQDKWRLSLEKDSQGRYYMMIPMYNPDGLVSMMGFRVLTSTYQTIGTFTLGESGLFKIEQEALTIRMGYGIDFTTATVSGSTVVTSVTSDFDNNRMRIIVENFFKDYIATNNIGSFVTASFATVKAALLKP